ncbi:MAG: hypothetical protein PHU12_04085 [Candidatus Aenigmarchaeota archaeon]|nr:hypothetical protein [Candidatus Aenigmarchaeota archaeon]
MVTIRERFRENLPKTQKRYHLPDSFLFKPLIYGQTLIDSISDYFWDDDRYSHMEATKILSFPIILPYLPYLIKREFGETKNKQPTITV